MVRTYSGSPDEKAQISRQYLSMLFKRFLRSSLDLAMAVTMKKTIEPLLTVAKEIKNTCIREREPI